MAKRVSRFHIGSLMTGRILSFDRLKGYGFIRTADDEDILFSSYDVPKNIWKRISVGDYVKFVVGSNDDTNNPVVATNTTIIKKMPRHLTIIMPNRENLEVRHIYQFGRNSLLKDGYKEVYPDYSSESFDYVFIKTSERTFTFNNHGSPIIIDGEIGVDGFYKYLSNLLIDYDIDRDYESF